MSASFSADGRYRFELTRELGPNRGREAVFVMLNPSTADAEKDDPTIRRCVGFAKAWGCGRLRVVNLFAFRSTEPRGLLACADPVGVGNDGWIFNAARSATAGGVLVFAWGSESKMGTKAGRALLVDRARSVRAQMPFFRASALGFTKCGQPSHPLFVGADMPLFTVPLPPMGAS